MRTQRVCSPSLSSHIAAKNTPMRLLGQAIWISRRKDAEPSSAALAAKSFLDGMESWPRPEYNKILLSSEFPTVADIYFRHARLAVWITPDGILPHQQIAPRLRRVGIKPVCFSAEEVLRSPSATLWPLGKELARRMAP